MVSVAASTNVVGLAQGSALPLDFDVDPARVSQPGVDLESLLRAVDVVPVDSRDHVAVFDADLLEKRVHPDGEDLESLCLAVLEPGDKSGLHRYFVQIGERPVDLC